MSNSILKASAAATALMLAGLMAAAPALAQASLTATFADPAWNGETIPEGQHCALQGGNGASPALNVTNIPDGTTQIIVAFNDETYTPMDDGGHGSLAFAVTPSDGAATLPSVPGATEEMPEGVTIAAPNKTAGDFLMPGYVPPCSGGNGNTYTADIRAVDASGAVLAETHLVLGKY